MLNKVETELTFQDTGMIFLEWMERFFQRIVDGSRTTIYGYG